MVSQRRNYRVTTVAEAKLLVQKWLEQFGLVDAIGLGLPEIDDRYHVWRVPLLSLTEQRLGEVVIDAYKATIVAEQTTQLAMVQARLAQAPALKGTRLETPRSPRTHAPSPLQSTIALGDCVEVLATLPPGAIDLIFTSPPYFNARPEYGEFEQYDSYLGRMRQAIRACHRVLGEGRFFVMNTAPVLLRRAHRQQSSRRLAVPFDLHRIFVEEGFDFIDDIIWVKPEGAGWATGRGRRFAADRNPLQYKAVPVTEYVLVYRKQTDLLIDWHIRHHSDPAIVAASKIADGYDRTNVWHLKPATHAKHPAAFPIELAEKVITYYSFQQDVVLDPFAGSGTVGAAASKLDRRFVLVDNNPDYVRQMQQAVGDWVGESIGTVQFLQVPHV
jgi:DNA modification methylase